VPDVVRAFRPSVLVTQHGCDSHVDDPLAHLTKTVDGQRAAYLALHELAHQTCEGRWVATDGGDASYTDWSSGYNPDTWLDRAIKATRDASFPLLGLDPSY
jgi:acetoin utilization protein AcuC